MSTFTLTTKTAQIGLVKGIIMAFLSLGEAYHRRVSERCLGVSGKYILGVWKAYVRCLEGVLLVLTNTN